MVEWRGNSLYDKMRVFPSPDFEVLSSSKLGGGSQVRRWKLCEPLCANPMNRIESNESFRNFDHVDNTLVAWVTSTKAVDHSPHFALSTEKKRKEQGDRNFKIAHSSNQERCAVRQQPEPRPRRSFRSSSRPSRLVLPLRYFRSRRPEEEK